MEGRLVTGLALLVVLLLVGGYAAELANAPAHPRDRALRPFPPATFRVSAGSWTGTNVTLNSTCRGCASNVTAGSALAIALVAVPGCGTYGCSRTLESLNVSPPFALLSVSPSIPAPLAPAGSSFNVTVGTPLTGGPYVLTGSGRASAPPGPVQIASMSWSPRNRTGGTEGLTMLPSVVATLVAPSASFNVTLLTNNTGSYPDIVENLSVETPFVLLGGGPGFPFEVDPGASWRLFATLQAPSDPGNFTIVGRASVAPLPQDIVGPFTVQFVGMSVALNWSGADFPSTDLPGEEFNGSLVLGNPTNASHLVQFNRSADPWLFVNGTPNGSFTIPAFASVRYYLTLSAHAGPGTYPVTLVFSILSDPRPGGPITRRRPTG